MENAEKAAVPENEKLCGSPEGTVTLSMTMVPPDCIEISSRRKYSFEEFAVFLKRTENMELFTPAGKAKDCIPLQETGVAFEASNLKTDFRYAVWALSRADVAGPIYAGADVKVFDDGKGDFDARLVVGYRVYAKLALEIYSLEENRPIAFSFVYKF